ncbi:hypothetical protein [Sporomusa sp.]|uniref:hypothetical protein n=1 Tax=Sporomusa sp. TaxID=2078658 RepID=UPI002CD0831D|nr:hypothetical protein [Sporomusa sp.]HWR45538.1 hypothetical protein [Sporomusa sp.]
MQSDASSAQQEPDNELQLLAESFQKACRKMCDSGKEHREIAQIIKQMGAIAREICSLSEYEVPTMRKL